MNSGPAVDDDVLRSERLRQVACENVAARVVLVSLHVGREHGVALHPAANPRLPGRAIAASSTHLLRKRLVDESRRIRKDGKVDVLAELLKLLRIDIDENPPGGSGKPLSRETDRREIEPGTYRQEK